MPSHTDRLHRLLARSGVPSDTRPPGLIVGKDDYQLVQAPPVTLVLLGRLGDRFVFAMKAGQTLTGYAMLHDLATNEHSGPLPTHQLTESPDFGIATDREYTRALEDYGYASDQSLLPAPSQTWLDAGFHEPATGLKHQGPGNHPSGSPQSVHGTPGGEEAWQREHGDQSPKPKLTRPHKLDFASQKFLNRHLTGGHMALVEATGYEENGIRSTLRNTFVSNDGSFMYFETAWTDKDGNEVGGTEQKLYPATDSSPKYVEIQSFSFQPEVPVDPAFLDKTVSRLEREYRRAGVAAIEVQARGWRPNGGSFWAERDYGFSGTPTRDRMTRAFTDSWNKAYKTSPVPTFRTPKQLLGIRGPDGEEIGRKVLDDTGYIGLKNL